MVRIVVFPLFVCPWWKARHGATDGWTGDGGFNFYFMAVLKRYHQRDDAQLAAILQSFFCIVKSVSGGGVNYSWAVIQVELQMEEPSRL